MCLLLRPGRAVGELHEADATRVQRLEHLHPGRHIAAVEKRKRPLSGERRGDLVLAESRHGQASSKRASISTGMSSGSDPMPTALRTPIPCSGPQISAKSSLAPLIT